MPLHSTISYLNHTLITVVFFFKAFGLGGARYASIFAADRTKKEKRQNRKHRWIRDGVLHISLI